MIEPAIAITSTRELTNDQHSFALGNSRLAAEALEMKQMLQSSTQSTSIAPSSSPPPMNSSNATYETSHVLNMNTISTPFVGIPGPIRYSENPMLTSSSPPFSVTTPTKPENNLSHPVTLPPDQVLLTTTLTTKAIAGDSKINVTHNQGCERNMYVTIDIGMAAETRRIA